MAVPRPTVNASPPKSQSHKHVQVKRANMCTRYNQLTCDGDADDRTQPHVSTTFSHPNNLCGTVVASGCNPRKPGTNVHKAQTCYRKTPDGLVPRAIHICRTDSAFLPNPAHCLLPTLLRHCAACQGAPRRFARSQSALPEPPNMPRTECQLVRCKTQVQPQTHVVIL